MFLELLSVKITIRIGLKNPGQEIDAKYTESVDSRKIRKKL